MKVRLTGDAPLKDVLRQLGVQDGDVARVARQAGLDAAAVVPAGREIVVDDAFVPKGAPPSTVTGAPVTGADAAPLGAALAQAGQRLGALGLFGVQAAFDGAHAPAAATADNPLGALAALSSVDLVNLGAGLVEQAQLDVRVPLLPGVRAIPVGDKRVLVDVPPGTTAQLSATLGPSPPKPGLFLQGAALRLSPGVTLKNPADLSFVDKSVLADVANALVTVKLDGMTLDKDGAVTPQGTVTRPSMNPFKHVFSSGKSESALSTWVSLAGKPRVRTGIADLARGDVLRERPALAAGDLPVHLDPGALLDGLGAVTAGGSFSLRVDGRAGFVDVKQGRLDVVGRDRALTATLSGRFAVKDGAVALEAEARATAPVDVRISFDETGAPGAAVGPLSVRAKDGAVEVAVQGALLAAVKAVAGRFHVAVPPGVRLSFDGTSLVSGSAVLRAGKDGLVVEDGEVRAVIDAAGAKASADTLDVTLGEGSRIELEATGVRVDGQDVVVENVAGGFSATAAGAAKAGPLTATVSGAGADGQVSLDLRGGVPTGEGSVRWSLAAKPRLAGIPLPGRGHVDGGARVVLTKDAVGFANDARVRLGW